MSFELLRHKAKSAKQNALVPVHSPVMLAIKSHLVKLSALSFCLELQRADARIGRSNDYPLTLLNFKL